MPKSKKQRMERPDDIPVRAVRRRGGRGEDPPGALTLHRSRVLFEHEQFSPSDFTEARIRLLTALLYHLLKNTFGDAKVLAFMAACSDAGASDEDKAWLAKVMESVKGPWPKGF